MISYIIAGIIIAYAAVVVIKKVKNKGGRGCGCSGDCTKCGK